MLNSWDFPSAVVAWKWFFKIYKTIKIRVFLKKKDILPVSKIKSPLFLFQTTQIKSIFSFPGHGQCTVSHDTKQVLYLIIGYFEIGVSLKKCESQK